MFIFAFQMSYKITALLVIFRRNGYKSQTEINREYFSDKLLKTYVMRIKTFFIILLFPFLQLFGQKPNIIDSNNLESKFEITDKGVLFFSNIKTDTLVLQQFRLDKWIRIDTIINLKGKTYSKYIHPYIHSGKNKFRITPIHLGYFIPIMYTYLSNKNCVITFNIKRPDVIIFSDSTYFELYDKRGTLIKKGIDNKMQISKINRKDTYILFFDNKKQIIK